MSHSLNPPHAPQAGAIQGIIIALTAFLPILAIVSLAPAVPTLIQHFAGVPYVETLVPLMLTAPGLVIAIAGPCTGWLADKFGRRKLLLSATLLYGICGTMPLLSLIHISVTDRLIEGHLAEIGLILKTVQTDAAFYFLSHKSTR